MSFWPPTKCHPKNKSKTKCQIQLRIIIQSSIKWQAFHRVQSPNAHSKFSRKTTKLVYYRARERERECVSHYHIKRKGLTFSHTFNFLVLLLVKAKQYFAELGISRLYQRSIMDHVVLLVMIGVKFDI